MRRLRAELRRTTAPAGHHLSAVPHPLPIDPPGQDGHASRLERPPVIHTLASTQYSEVCYPLHVGYTWRN